MSIINNTSLCLSTMLYIILSTCFLCVLFDPHNNCRSSCPPTPTLRCTQSRHIPFLQMKNHYSSESYGYLPKVTQLESESVRTQTHMPLMAKLSTTACSTSKFSGEVKASADWHWLPTASPQPFLLPHHLWIGMVNLGDPKIWLMERSRQAASLVVLPAGCTNQLGSVLCTQTKT